MTRTVYNPPIFNTLYSRPSLGDSLEVGVFSKAASSLTGLRHHAHAEVRELSSSPDSMYFIFIFFNSTVRANFSTLCAVFPHIVLKDHTAIIGRKRGENMTLLLFLILWNPHLDPALQDRIYEEPTQMAERHEPKNDDTPTLRDGCTVGQGGC